MTSSGTSRRVQRIYAMQALYAWDMYPDQESKLLTFSWKEDKGKKIPPYASEIVKGVIAHCTEVDQHLSAALKSWTLDRLQGVDRAILRIGVYTLLYCPDTPVAVIINEAVEIAKKFSNSSSPSFINGILDTIGHQRVVSHDEAENEI